MNEDAFLTRSKNRAKREKTSVEIAIARQILVENLESDFTGTMTRAALTFDQTVQWSIAKSMQALAEAVSRIADKP